MDELRVRKATRDDVPDVLAILDEAAQWLASIGVEQWPSPFPRIVLERDLQHGTIWLVTLDQRPIATASVLTNDPMFWGTGVGCGLVPASAGGPSIRRRDRPCGSRADRRSGIKSGRECVRLDCGVGLRSYYEDAGYSLRSWLSLLEATSSPPRSEWFCYEKTLVQP